MISPGQHATTGQGRPLGAPKLLVFVDTEEEFDWSKPHSRAETSVAHIKHQIRTQSIFERFGIKPTYVVDYPVASQESGYRILREWADDSKCQIGAHLHPWVNPPFEEDLSLRNSFPGNLPARLEREKLALLSRMIETNFLRRPTIYRAGRYGIGGNTGAVLEELGYEIDSSIVPYTDFSTDHGPDFSNVDDEPFWFGPCDRIIELPLTVGWHGALRRYGARYQRGLMSKRGVKLHIPGLLARLRLLERIRLTPEGTSLAELKRLTDATLRAGKRVFVFSFHSPSVEPGHTPYVRDVSDLRRFLALIEAFCEYFLGACGGEASTPHAVRDLYVKPERHTNESAIGATVW